MRIRVARVGRSSSSELTTPWRCIVSRRLAASSARASSQSPIVSPPPTAVSSRIAGAGRSAPRKALSSVRAIVTEVPPRRKASLTQ